MMDMHGGNTRKLADGALDLSASINPLGMPKGALRAIRDALKDNASALGHYPDPDAVDITGAIAKRYRIDRNRILAGNGSTELIYLIPRALRPETVLVTAPTFSEFERSALASGAKVKRLELKRKDNFAIDLSAFMDAMAEADLAVLCNPNNPTGSLIKRDYVLRIASHAKREKCTLLIDEAFMDFCPKGHSVLGDDNPNLIVLRSLTKFYALAGLRLGFAYLPPAVYKQISAIKEPWSLNTLAQLAGVEALKDKQYADKSVALISRERKYMLDRLSALGFGTVTGEANYLLIKTPDASAMTERLLRKSIAVRDCGNFKGPLRNNYIRVAVRGRRDNMRFLAAFSEVTGP